MIFDNAFGKYEIVEPWQVSEIVQVPAYIPSPLYSVTGIPDEPPDEIEIKNPNQIECMGHSCILAKQILRKIRPMIKVKLTSLLCTPIDKVPWKEAIVEIFAVCVCTSCKYCAEC